MRSLHPSGRFDERPRARRMKMCGRMWGALALLCWGAGCFATACAAAEDEFFKGKQLKIIIGGSPGDGYDVYSRILAKHLSTHLPGNPSILPQNMPGAAGVVAAAYVFNAAPRDGSVIGSATTGVPTDALLNDTPPQFDVKACYWSEPRKNAPNWIITI